MIKTGIEAVGEFCYIFRTDLSKEITLNAVSLIEKKCDLSTDLYSQMDIMGVRDYSIFTLGQILSVSGTLVPI
jgi:hypothetical protein